MIVISENIKLLDKDIALLTQKSGEKLINNVITVQGSDDLYISIENMNCKNN